MNQIPQPDSALWPFYTIISLLLWSLVAYLGSDLDDLPAFFLLGVAFLIGTIPSLLHFKTWFVQGKVMLIGVGGLLGYHLFLFLALRLAPPVEANLINYLWPVLIVLMTPLFFKDARLKLHHICGAIVAFSGAILAVSGGKFQFTWQTWPGYLLALLAALTWSTYSLTTKKLSPFPNSAIGGFCFLSGLLALSIHFFTEEPTPVNFFHWPKLFLLGLGPMGVAFYTWDRAMKAGDPRIIGALSYLTPLLSTAVLIFFGEKQVPNSIYLAVLLIMSGAAISSLDSFKSFFKGKIHSGPKE